MSYKLLIINPGSTSTKIGVYEDEKEVLVETLRHSSDEIGNFKGIFEQLDFRKDVILDVLKEKNFDINTLDAIVGRGGLLKSIEGGTYAVNEVMLHDLKIGVQGQHASNLGGIIANEIGKLADKTTTAVNEIRQTTGKVQEAFDHILEHSRNLLSFIQDTVTPDYKTFVNVGNQYKVDANDIQISATKLADMTHSIEKVINEVGEAIQGIAVSAENTATNSSTIITHMDKVAELVDTVAQAAIQEKKMSNNLDEVVKKFTLE